MRRAFLPCLPARFLISYFKNSWIATLLNRTKFLLQIITFKSVMENNEPIVNEEQSSTPAASNGTTNRPSNLRSRWKRKNSGTGAQKAKASNLGEIDPASVPSEDKLENHASEPAERESSEQPSERPAPRRPQAHQAQREPYQKRERAPREEYYRSPRDNSNETSGERSYERKPRTPREGAPQARSHHADKPKMAPATYKPCSLPKDTLWQRIKEFFNSLMGKKTPMFEIKSEPYKTRDQGFKKRGNYSRSRGNGQGSRSRNQDHQSY